jgi:hypothetical protein
MSIFRTEDGDVRFLGNSGVFRRVYTAPRPGRIAPWYSPQWKPQVSHDVEYNITKTFVFMKVV